MESENSRRSPDRRSASHRLPARELIAAFAAVWLAANLAVAAHNSSLAVAARDSSREGGQQQPPRDLRPPSTPQTSFTGRIIGRVVDETGRPLRKARVTIGVVATQLAGLLAPANRAAFISGGLGPPGGDLPPPPPPGENASAPFAFTDNDGRFEISGLAAGQYTVAVRKAGYVPTTYGARHQNEPPIAIDLGDGSRADVIVRVMRSAGISGRLTDQFGDPIEGAFLTAERLIRSEGRIMTRGAGTATTDDLGEYRLGGLAASRYVVNAYVNRSGGDSVVFLLPPADSAAIQELMTRVPGMSQLRTYYPGVSGLVDAQPIEVRAGEERTSVDFVVPPETSFPTLTLTFADADGKAVPADATLANTSGQIPRFLPVLARSPRVATRVEPGTWTVLARGNSGVGLAEVVMGAGDASVSIALGKGGRVAGRVEMDGAPAAAMRALPRIVAVHPADTSVVSRWGNTAVTRPDGTFQIGDLLGPLVLRVFGPPKGWTVKAILYDGRDLSDTPIDFKADSAISGVRVVMTNRTAALTGSVTDAHGVSSADYSVLLFPEDRTLAVRRFARWARPNQQGRFSIEDLLPGDYLAIALTDVDDTQWQNADYLDRFRAQATHLTLGESDRNTVTLTLLQP